MIKLNWHSPFHMKTNHSNTSRLSGIGNVLHKYRDVSKGELSTLIGVEVNIELID